MDYVSMGKRIRLLRREAGWTQAELAKRAGISTSYLGYMERGQRTVSLEILVSIANALSARLDYFVGKSLNECAETSPFPKGLDRQERKALHEILSILQACDQEDE